MLATVSALSAQNLGAGKEKRATDTLHYATVITTIYGMIVAVLIQFIAENVVGIFTSDTTVVTMGSAYIRSYIWDCIFAGIHFSFSGYFAGMWKVLYRISAQYNFDYICACSGFVSGIEIFYRYAVSNGTCGTGGVTGIRGNLCDCIYIVKEKKPCGTDSMNQDGKSFNR